MKSTVDQVVDDAQTLHFGSDTYRFELCWEINKSAHEVDRRQNHRMHVCSRLYYFLLKHHPEYDTVSDLFKEFICVLGIQSNH